MSRMQKYESFEETNRPITRTKRNQELYQDTGTFEKYTTFTDIPKIEAIDLSTAKRNYRTREGYHQMKDYPLFHEKKQEQKELDEFDFLYRQNPKTYDINRVLEEAKKSRDKDELEQKRKLHNEKYNILESSEEELAKFKEEKEKKAKPVVDNEEELQDLIDTITSKELKDEIDEKMESSLLSDLMATTSEEETVEPIQEAKETSKIEPKEGTPAEEKHDLVKNIDESFYTRSLDLSDQDFDDEDELEDSKTPFYVIFLRIIFSLLLIVAVGIGVYYVVMNF